MSEPKVQNQKPTVKRGKIHPGGSNPKARKPNAVKASAKPFAWLDCTKASVDFVKKARALATALSLTYGEGFSISKFEKVLAELPSMSVEHKSLLSIDSTVLDLFRGYKSAKEARDSERESLRSFRTVEAITTGLEMADKLQEE